MATYTTNLDLIKPAGTDKIRIAQLNENMDTLDAAIGAVGNTSLQAQVSANNQAISAVQNGLAYIVGNTNTTGGTLAVGQFVYVKGHSTIAEGLRKVTASISANGSITTSNTDACSEGGLNALNSKIDNKIKSELFTVTNTWIVSSNAFGSPSLNQSLPSGAKILAAFADSYTDDGVNKLIWGQRKNMGLTCWNVTGSSITVTTGDVIRVTYTVL